MMIDGEAEEEGKPSPLRTFGRAVGASRLPARQLVKAAINYKHQRRFWLRLAAFDLLAKFSPAVAVETEGTRYYLATADWPFSRVVFGMGSYEGEIMAEAIALVERATHSRPLLRGRTFIDVGANIGTSSIPAVKKFGASEVIAFEPDAETYKLLRCNVIANDLEDRVRTIRTGLSNSSGAGILEHSETSWADHRIRIGDGAVGGVFNEANRATVEVPLARLDDVVRDLPIDLDRVGLLWMDVQGHEAHVLAGASNLLARDIPVVMEYWPYALRRADGLSMLNQIVADNYTRVVDVRASMSYTSIVEVPAAKLSELEAIYGEDLAYTDLILLK
jgi:FkbM family methyltransferase